LGQTVYQSYLKEQVQAAVNNTSLEVGVKTKNFNMFCQSAEVWISDDYIMKASRPVDMKQLEGELCYMGVDLSAVSDLTSISVMFPPNPDRKLYPDKFIFKSKVYVPQEALETSSNADIYKEWRRYRIVDVTAGNVVDYDYILLDQKEIMAHTCLYGVFYDSYNATQWAINATNEGLPLEPYS
jgi:phage terminase large subunit-like protein